MDLKDRMHIMLRRLLARKNIQIRTTKDALHAKLILTDKHLVVSSVNLNKMNLGFEVNNQYWRENTESIAVCSDVNILVAAKDIYLKVFHNCTDMEVILADGIKKEVRNIFTSTFSLSSKKEVKELFARLIIRKQIQVEEFVLEIGKISAKLMKHLNKRIIDKNVFIMSLILYYLSERKQDFNQINEQLSILSTEINLNDLLLQLLANGFIEKVDDYYKIKLDKLF